MATKKTKIETIELWAEQFPSLSAWGEKYLLQRNGPLVSGICLDETRDPNKYLPVFFFHNLICTSERLSLGYGVAYHYRVGRVPISYESSVEDVAKKFSAQVESLNCEITYELFLRQIRSSLTPEAGFSFSYLPHALRDAITIGSYLGEREFFLSKIQDSCELIRKFPRVNMSIIGSVEKWREDVEGMVASISSDAIEGNSKSLQLPLLDIKKLEYVRPEKFPECLRTYP